MGCLSAAALSHIKGMPSSWLLLNVRGRGSAIGAMQVSAIVQRFYECLLRGDDYKDGCWEDWQNNHPADLAARGVQQGGAAGGGRGNCFK